MWRHAVVIGNSYDAVIGDRVEFAFAKESGDTPSWYRGKIVEKAKVMKVFKCAWDHESEEPGAGLSHVQFDDGDLFLMNLSSEKFQATSSTSIMPTSMGMWRFSGDVAYKSRLKVNASADIFSVFLASAAFGDGSSPPHGDYLTWFYVDDKSFLNSQRMAIFNASFDTFKRRTNMKVSTEIGDGWCGYRTGERQLQFLDGDDVGSFVSTAKVLVSALSSLNNNPLAEAFASASEAASKGPVEPGIEIHDSSDDDRPVTLKMKSELSRHDRLVRNYKDLLDNRSSIINAALERYSSTFLPSDSGAWFDADFDLRAIAYSKNITCYF